MNLVNLKQLTLGAISSTKICVSGQWILLAPGKEIRADLADLKLRHSELVALHSIVLKSDRSFWLVTAAEEAARDTRGVVLGLVEPSRALGGPHHGLGEPNHDARAFSGRPLGRAGPEHHHSPGATAPRP